MKNKVIIPIMISIGLVFSGLLNIFLWYTDKVSIYGLVLGCFSLILAWFVFHFRKKK